MEFLGNEISLESSGYLADLFETRVRHMHFEHLSVAATQWPVIQSLNKICQIISTENWLQIESKDNRLKSILRNKILLENFDPESYLDFLKVIFLHIGLSNFS